MPENQTAFRISSALKKIIGRDLITDDFIAVFELVKNSFDAHARNVTIQFENINSTNSRLLIIDDGKGMTPDDIDNKWLFVAYSAKHEGIEDDLFSQSNDYRNRTTSKRTFAGAKGIGRFSCDRLGRFLKLMTRASTSTDFEVLEIDWKQFENDSRKEFVNIPVKMTFTNKIPFDLKIGTILEISNLREKWDRTKLLRLRDELRKLINPNQEHESDQFNVMLRVPQESNKDLKESDENKKVNGRIKNFLFEQLGLKTTQIQCEFSNTGDSIVTTLIDRGSLIYKIKERNATQNLKNIRINLFVLNMASKRMFHNAVGTRNVHYGSVFVYKNGFRVHPYGNFGDDGLGIDHRKQQGQARFIGTRDLSGRIEINGVDTYFKETSSRNAGFIESAEWNDLLKYFQKVVLRRLEKYAIDTIKWGNPLKYSDDSIRPEDVKTLILAIINKLTDSPNLISIQYDSNILDILSQRQSKSVLSTIDKLKRIAFESGDLQMQKEIVETERRINDLRLANEELEKEAKSAQDAQKDSENKYETERRKNLFLLSTAGSPNVHRLALEHWIKASAGAVRAHISNLIYDVKRDKLDKAKLLDSLSKIKRWVDETENVSKIVTKADFNLQAEVLIGFDLGAWIYEYLKNDDFSKENFRMVLNYDNKPFITKFRPMAITILLDNLIDNAGKANAKQIITSITTTNSGLVITMANDGEAIKNSQIESLFELGISSTGGSGIGLHTCRDIMREMNGEITFSGNDAILGGAKFTMEFHK